MNSLKISKICTAIVFLSLQAFCGSLKAQSMIVESISGPLTQNEINAFKTYAKSKKSTLAPAYGGSNIWVFGAPGNGAEGIGLMYEASRDTSLLNLLIYMCDAALYSRNDIAPAGSPYYGQRPTWTGNIDPIWTSAGTDITTIGGCVESGMVMSHIAFCAYQILQTPSIWDKNVSIGDPRGFGATYKARALKYIQECDYVIDNWFIPRFLKTSENNHIYFPGAPNTYKPGDPAPWNQLFFMINSLVRLTSCHLLLDDAPARVTQYDNIVQPNLDWFFANLTANTSGIGTACWKWRYAIGGSIEDTNHAAYDIEGLYIAYATGRYGIKFSDMVSFANTYFDIVLATVTNGIYAGRVDGTTGTGNSGGDNYVRDEYLYLSEFRSDAYSTMANININKNKIPTSIEITGRLLWQKNRRYVATNATLKDLKVDGVAVTGFNASTLTYNVVTNSNAVPAVTATAFESGAQVNVTPAAQIPGTTTVKVTAPDGSTTKTYTINFTGVTGINDIKSRDKIFSITSTDNLNINYNLTSKEHVRVDVYKTSGQKVITVVNNTQYPGNYKVNLNASDFANGIYLVSFVAGKNKKTAKWIVAQSRF